MVKLADFDLVREIRALDLWVDGNRVGMAYYGTNAFVKAFFWALATFFLTL